MALKRALRRAWHAVFVLTGDGSWTLRPHERLIIDAALAALTDEVRERVRAQLEHAYFVERTSDRVSVLRFYERRDDLAIPDPAFADCLMKVQIAVDERKQYAHVTFYRGYIFSVELKKPRKLYVDRQITVCSVQPGQPGESYTRGIDRLEHGRSEEDEP